MEIEVLSALVATVLLFVLLFTGVHIGVALGLSGVLGAVMYTGRLASGLSLPLIVAESTTTTFSLLVIPLFILMGTLAAEAGITSDLFSTALKWLGRIPGGLAITVVASSAGMAAVTGSSVATSSTMTAIALPEMRKLHYDESLATGICCTGGTLALMIPPSTTLVLFAIFAEQSIGQLLLAGILPGLLTAVLYSAMVLVRCIMNPSLGPKGPVVSWRERWASVPGVLPFLLLIAAIVLGILYGVWTPVEAAAGGVVVVGLIGLTRRRLTFNGVSKAFIDAVVTSTSVMMVVVGSMVFSAFLALSGVNEQLIRAVERLGLPSFALMLMVVLLYLVLGMFMEATSIMALTIPIMMPIVMTVGWNPIWFGIIITKMIELAMVTPPVGLNLYAVKAVAPEVSLRTIWRGVFPFCFMDLAVVVAIYFIPGIALLLPRLMIK